MSVPIRYLEPSSRSRPRRRRSSHGPRRARRLPPAGVVAILVLLALGAGGVAWLLSHRANEKRKDAIAAFGAAWERGDYQAMYDRLDAGSRARVSRVSFVRAYRRAATASTLRRIAVAEPKKAGDDWELA